ncbi:MerR family transcriptional regulator [Amycolatopsis taiwanensis]|uniref:MerR family transcriptional regulator n=1 Tax=Amycolatopsis taiwanensis TaxID=342230 RepID=A0A9W6VGP7_9PSEU|nr:MerR family transcriptional regulator [Amycolatopsis taiwanensis]GLY66682.1 MerR family transcriptional regulator [Amycolatopsis taiwanensis]
MRIGEVAALAGVSTRTVRHYHHIGLLPEPRRRGNGYRSYDLRDLVLLLRARRLTELGLGLDEVRDALADDSGVELAEILAELDADLAAQQHRLQVQRDRIAAVLAAGGETRSPELVAALKELTAVLGPDHPGLEREKLIAEHVDATTPDHAPYVWAVYRKILADSDLRERIVEVNRRFEQLADLASTDPAVDDLARDAGSYGQAIKSFLPPELGEEAGDPAAARRLLATVTAGMAPAQARCLTLMFEYWQAGA